MKNYLIVESQNDKFFLEAIIQHLNLHHIQIANATICNIDDYECMNGLNEKKIAQALSDLKDKSEKSSDTFHVGLVIDWDNETILSRLDLVKKAINAVFSIEATLTDTNQKIELEKDFFFSCYFNGVEQKGELETVLKNIKTASSPFADCLENWRECVGVTNISQKEFDKFWVANYIRFDTCSKEEKKQVARKCNLEAAMKKPIWDFEAPCLVDLKAFLLAF